MAGMGDSSIPVQVCPRCGSAMADIKGSRLAVCRRCGYKDDCC
jgi:ribosomal protein S27AE